MIELLQGMKVIDRDFEIEIEESKKRIKLLLRPGELKACIKRKEAESKLPPLPPHEPLIKVRWNHHLPFSTRL